MDLSTIKEYFEKQDSVSQIAIIKELTGIKDNSDFDLLGIKEKQLNNKQGSCPHCDSLKYTKDGREKSGVQRYRCSSCKRSFNPYTGTWLAKINKKELIVPYLKLMTQGLSLEKTRKALNINKKTAFDWRHKITASLDNIEKSDFIGITESDETFFLHSQKGSQDIDRAPRKRGKKASKRGISSEQVATIVTMDRTNSVDLKVVCLGRITKTDIEDAIGERISEKTVLCTDGHASYKGFAIDNELEHHVLRANIKQFIKQKKFHIQHVNSADSRLKLWIDKKMHGVATKYLQNYLNWFRLTEKFNDFNIIKKMVDSAISTTAVQKFRNIEISYLNLLLKTQKT